MFLLKVFSSKVYLDFQKDSEMATLRLTIIFTKVATIENKFCMSFLIKFSHSKKLCTKNERSTSFEKKFSTLNPRVRKKRLFRRSFILSMKG